MTIGKEIREVGEGKVQLQKTMGVDKEVGKQTSKVGVEVQ